MSSHQGTTGFAIRSLNPPVWFIDKGWKMKIAHYDAATYALTIAASAAQVRISPQLAGRGVGNWNLFWKVEHGHADVSGNVRLSDGELSRCFGLADGSGASGARVAVRMGEHLDAAELGAFVRLGDYLSIPGPAATGLEGDPCVSVLLTGDIRAAVKELILDRYK